MTQLSDTTLADLKERIGQEYVHEMELMKQHTNMEVGGPAAYLFEPGNAEELKYLIDTLKKEEYPYYVIGKGSNLIFQDEGFDGAVIKILDRFKGIEIDGERVVVGAGETNKDLSEALTQAGLSGFEFASGIPGCLGGGITMNAGAYEGEMKDVVEEVTVLTADGNIERIANADMAFGYRTSAVFERGYVVLGATLKLTKKDPADIQAKVDDLTERRESKQPLEYPSCGSVFKRPEGYFAGKLISDAGLKGMQIGGAQVSEKHAGFIVNKGGATAKDVLDLIAYVQKKVHEDFGVELKCEVKIL